MDVTNDTLMLTIAVTILAIYGVVVTVLLYRQRSASTSKVEVPPTGRQRPLAASEQDKERLFAQRADDALKLTTTFQKFIPRQFVDHFAKHGKTELALGYADEDEVAILFCDIRGFTGLSEKMVPQQLMSFLNSYFLRMNEPIHQNRGFIDKFIGDAIMALFDHPGGGASQKATDALNAALDLRKALALYNEHRKKSGYEPVDIGIGIHYGPVIIGTVGSEDRMDTTVIGDSVNIAYRLETLSPIYHADIIVSATTLNVIDSAHSRTTRLLDWVRVKGRQAPIEIYEVLNHLPEAQQQEKTAADAAIRAGIEMRCKQQWQQAIDLFEQARILSPNDTLASLHIDAIHQLKETSLAPDWDGAIVVETTHPR